MNRVGYLNVFMAFVLVYRLVILSRFVLLFVMKDGGHLRSTEVKTENLVNKMVDNFYRYGCVLLGR